MTNRFKSRYSAHQEDATQNDPTAAARKALATKRSAKSKPKSKSVYNSKKITDPIVNNFEKEYQTFLKQIRTQTLTPIKPTITEPINPPIEEQPTQVEPMITETVDSNNITQPKFGRKNRKQRSFIQKDDGIENTANAENID